MNETERDRNAELKSLGLSLAILEGPTAVRRAEPEGGGIQFRYLLELQRNGAPVWRGEYFTGTGWADLSKLKNRVNSNFGIWQETQQIYNTLTKKPYAQLKDKTAELKFWEWVCAQKTGGIAGARKLLAVRPPSLTDVVSSLLLDSSAFFNAESFKEWAANFGYDSDSRQAEKIYNACNETGRQLSRGIPADDLAKIHEIMEGF